LAPVSASIVSCVVGHVRSMEVVKVVVVVEVFTTSRESAVISEARIVATVYMTVESGSMMPAACADKDAVIEPLRPIVAVGSATIWRIPVLAIGTRWLRAYVDAKCHLRASRLGSAEHQECKSCD